MSCPPPLLPLCLSPNPTGAVPLHLLLLVLLRRRSQPMSTIASGGDPATVGSVQFSPLVESKTASFLCSDGSIAIHADVGLNKLNIRWKDHEGKEIEVFQEFKVVTSDVISMTAFGSSYLQGKSIFEMLMKLAFISSRKFLTVSLPGVRFQLYSQVPTIRQQNYGPLRLSICISK